MRGIYLFACLLVLVLATASRVGFCEDAKSADQIRGEIRLLSAKLANKNLTSEERMKYAQEKNQLQQQLNELVGNSGQQVSGDAKQTKRIALTTSCPEHVRLFWDRCGAEKADLVQWAIKRRESARHELQKISRQKTNVSDKRDGMAVLQEQMASCNTLIVSLNRYDTVVPPFILDKTQTKATLLPGMLGKTRGLKVVKIVGPDSAIVHIYIPEARTGKTVTTRIMVADAATVTQTETTYEIPETGIFEHSQDLFVQGIDTRALYDGAVYDFDIVLEVTGVRDVQGRRIPEAKLFDVKRYLIRENQDDTPQKSRQEARADLAGSPVL